MRITGSTLAREPKSTRVLRKRPIRDLDNAPVRKKRRTGRASTSANGLVTPEPSTLTEEPTVAPKEIFVFLKLPAELRIHIYRMALLRDEPLLLHKNDRVAEDEKDDCAFDQNRRRRPSDVSNVAVNEDPVNVALLRINQQIYKEARQALYADNTFILSLTTGISTLASLHQRSRSLIKSVTLTIPSHHDILDGFADLVRLGLRYCWGLQKFTIVLDLMFPGDDRGSSSGSVTLTSSATTVYANAFRILRWLPRACKVGLEGNVSEVVRRVVAEEGRLLECLDEASYLKRQHQMPERH